MNKLKEEHLDLFAMASLSKITFLEDLKKSFVFVNSHMSRIRIREYFAHKKNNSYTFLLGFKTTRK